MAMATAISSGGSKQADACRMSAVVKRYGGVTVLDLDELRLAPGEVHALVGHNGAGKSTLVKVLAGVTRPDGGTIEIGGEEVRFSGAADAIKHGVAPVFQELLVVPQRTALENANLGVPLPRFGPFVNKREMMRRTLAVAERVGLTRAQLESPAERLGVAALQRVAICRALQLDASVFIFDEPTASLSEAEVSKLFEVIGDLRAGGAAVLYISHRLEELPVIADRITVMRDGRRIDTVASDLPRTELVELMTGHPHEEPDRSVAGAEESDAEVVLAARELGVRKGQSIDFEARAGELLGFFGLVGAGRSSIGRALVGAQPIRHGELELAGEKLRLRSPRGAALRGIGYIPDDRRRAGLVLEKSLAFNVALSPKPRFRRLGAFVDFRRERRATAELLARLGIRSRGLDQAVGELSGGNQQKVLLARWLLQGARALVVDEPTAGLDVEAREEVYSILREMAANGAAIVFISSDVDEVVDVCDRVLVMRDHAIVAEMSGSAITKTTILNHCYQEVAA
jgi:ribose transport system ATP-binding protein